MILSLIAAAAENNVLGKDNQLIWKLADDMAYFKEKTLFHSVIMGRKTFDSMGKALPKRRNIIVTRTKNLIIPSAEVVHSIEEALKLCKQNAPEEGVAPEQEDKQTTQKQLEREQGREEEEVFVIGGAALYALALPIADRIYLTRVHAQPEGDVFFPEFKPEQWKLISEEERPADHRNQFPFSFLLYEKVAV